MQHSPPTARPWSSPQQGMCCPSHLAKALPRRAALPSPCVSLQWEWSGYLLQPPNTVSLQEKKDLITAVQEPNKERSGRQVSEEILPLWMLAAHSGADHSGRPHVNQTPPGSRQGSPGGDKLCTEVSISHTDNKSAVGGSKQRQEPKTGRWLHTFTLEGGTTLSVRAEVRNWP